MKKVSERIVDNEIYVTMRIPNIEIESIYRNHISNWFDAVKKETDRTALYRAIVEKDSNGVADYLTEFLKKTISTFESSEDFYHVYFLSLL